jgi:surface polysaccharide O-acyltransferase-like enzyme
MLQFLRPPLVVSSASAFFLLLQLGRSTLTALPRLHAAVQRLASCALAVYLLHAYPLEFVRYKVQGTGAASLAGQTLTFLITLAVSWILAEALCRVPVLRRTLA